MKIWDYRLTWWSLEILLNGIIFAILDKITILEKQMIISIAGECLNWIEKINPLFFAEVEENDDVIDGFTWVCYWTAVKLQKR